MAELACTLSHVGGAASGCMENFSGVGDYFLVGLESDLSAVPEYDNTKAEFSTTSFAFTEGKGFYKVYIAKDSGSVTSASNGRKKGFNNTFTGRVEEIADGSFLMRIVNNTDVVILVPAGGDSYYVLYDPDSLTSLELSSTTGAAATDEAGHTVTFNVSKSLYPLVKWSGTPTIAGEDETT